jgi:hydroxymethylglutaryl-CoA lyase
MSLAGRLPRRVRVVEVGPRDGLQNEARAVETGAKVAFIERLLEAGHRTIEVTSFVSPERVPQLADAEEVFRRIPRPPGVTFTALVPNSKGMERALRAGARSVAVFVAASDAFNRANIGCTALEALARFKPVAEAAAREGIALRAYLSTAWVCPYQGRIDPREAAELAERLRDLGAARIALSDTIGAADPRSVDALLDAIEPRMGLEVIALHLHDTFKRGLANATVGLLRGVEELDSSAGGLGGCPFAPGAAGNLATGDLLSMLHAMGIETGIDEALHKRAVETIRQALAGPPS